MKKIVRIGRDPGNDIVLLQAGVSQQHAQIELLDRDGPRFLLRDLGSTNGTFIDGRRIEECEVGKDARITIGNVALPTGKLLAHFGLDGGAGSAKVERPSRLQRVLPSRFRGSDHIVIGQRNFRSGFLLPVLWFGLAAALLYMLTTPGFQLVPPLSIPRLLGALLTAAVAVQLSLVLLRQSRRIAYERQQQVLGLETLQSGLDVLLQRRQKEIKQDSGGWKGERKFEVTHKVSEGGDIVSFYLTPHDGKPLAAFKPGQYLTFALRVPGDKKPLVRCYSLSSSAAKLDFYRVSIKRVPPPRDKPELPPGKSSGYFHDGVAEGDFLDVRAPGGHFFLDLESQAPIVLIGGGVGLTPVLSMLDTAIDCGDRREIWFFYGVRNSQDQIMAAHFEAVAQEFEHVHVHICYSDPLPEERQGQHFDHAERVSVELMKTLLPSNNYQFYICGPPPMMASITADLQDWGVPQDDIHFEAFGPATVKRVAPASDVVADEEAIDVEFARSGKTLRWTPDSGSLLELAEANDLNIDCGCRAGNCGTCVIAIRSGRVDYLSPPGAEVEAGSCLACVARPMGQGEKLVLDV